MANPADVQYFTKALRSEPVVLDAVDFGLINRPRIFWCKVRRKELKNNPLTGKPIRWGRYQKIPRIHLDLPFTEATDIDLGDLSLPAAVERHHCRLPCLATPSPTEEGRPPPKKLRGRIGHAVKQRWLEDSRCYAPWHYVDNAMLRAPTGQLVAPTAEIKEQLHGFPSGFTALPDMPSRLRHKMLANSWRVGLARFVMLCVLRQCGAFGHPAPTPRRSALQVVMDFASVEETYVGASLWTTFTSAKPPTFGMMDHWHCSLNATHPLAVEPTLEPGLLQVLAKQLVGDLPRLRREVTEEISAWVMEQADNTARWMLQRPHHIQQVYALEDGSVVQVPILLDILAMLNYPGIDDLRNDLSCGFPVLGRLNPGTGWQPRTDERYSHPIGMATGYLRQDECGVHSSQTFPTSR